MVGFFRAPEHMREEILVNREFGEMPKQMTMTRRSKEITREQVLMRLGMTLLDCGGRMGTGGCGESVLWDRRH